MLGVWRLYELSTASLRTRKGGHRRGGKKEWSNIEEGTNGMIIQDVVPVRVRQNSVS